MNVLRFSVAAAVLAAAGCGTIPPVGPETQPPVVGEAQVARAQEELAGLPDAGRPHTAGYDRDRFGEPWADTDHNGCDTRNDILARDLAGIRRKRGCVVVSGVLHDPYTGRTIHFRRGSDTSSDVQVDHLYPLHRAWLYGAWKWDKQRRVTFANDHGNLLAVSGPANTSKGDSGPAEWAPHRVYRCAYAVDYIDVARIYGLPVTSADRRALRRMLNGCPRQREM